MLTHPSAQNYFLKPNRQLFKQCQKGFEQFYLKWIHPNKDYSLHKMVTRTLFCWAFDQSLYKNNRRYTRSLAYRKVFEYLNQSESSISEMHADEVRLICQILTNCIDSIYFGQQQNLQNLKIFVFQVWNKINSQIPNQKLNQNFRRLILSVAIRFPHLLVITGVFITFDDFKIFNPPRELFYTFLARTIFYQKNHLELTYDQITILLTKFSQEVYCSLKQERVDDYPRIGIVFRSILTQLTSWDKPLSPRHAFHQKLNENLVHWTCIRKNQSTIYRDWIRFLQLQLNSNSIFKQKINKVLTDSFILIVKKKCQKEIIQSGIIQFLDSREDLCIYFFQNLQKIKLIKIIDIFLNNLQTSIIFFTVLKKCLIQYSERVYMFLFPYNSRSILQQLITQISYHFDSPRFQTIFNEFMLMLDQRYPQTKQMKDLCELLQQRGYEINGLNSSYNYNN